MPLSPDDRLAITELVSRADDAATVRDPDAYVALFTPDGVLDGAKGEHIGRDAIHAATVDVWAGEG